MTSKATFSKLTNSKYLEIKMTNILSFYEDLAASIAFKSNPYCFEVVIVEKASTKNQELTKVTSKAIENVVKLIIPIKRSSDIVDYLIERELQLSLKPVVTA